VAAPATESETVGLEPPTLDAATGDATPPEAAVPAFDEVWRPGKRRETHRPARARTARPEDKGEIPGKRPPRRAQGRGPGKGRGQDRAKGQNSGQDQRHGQGGAQASGQDRGQGRKERAAAISEHSPFAALKALRDTLAARDRSES
jgi:hypothetical protein